MDSFNKKLQAISLFEQAWIQRQKELTQSYKKKISSLELEIFTLRNELENSRLMINFLEKEKQELQHNVFSAEKRQIKSLKTSFLNTLSVTGTSDIRKCITPRNSFRNSVGSPQNKYIDGKQFFAQARSRLSYSKFTKFLSYVRRINEKSISKDRAMIEVSQIFGGQNNDLYVRFANLLAKR